MSYSGCCDGSSRSYAGCIKPRYSPGNYTVGPKNNSYPYNTAFWRDENTVGNSVTSNRDCYIQGRCSPGNCTTGPPSTFQRCR